MNTAPKFFIPFADSDEQAERVYAGFAKSCATQVPEIGKRIYSITYAHNGSIWTATVGQQLSGTKTVTKGQGRSKVQRSHSVSDPATVLAIFAGNPYYVFTNGNLSVRSSWENPFLAGQPGTVVRFST